jgi:tRNA(His) 5'-end guanylyltransferase
MTAAFARAMRLAGVRELATFDARAFNIPEDEVANYFVWRAKDWARNSLSMYAQANFSHADLQGKKCKDMHNMLHDLGKNWTLDLSDAERNGTFIYNGDRLTDTSDIVPTFKSISALWRKVKPKETSEETP